MAVHYLKTWVDYFEASAQGLKDFDVRKNDRNFEVGDFVVLQEYSCPEARYTGRRLDRYIKYVLPGGSWGLDDKHVVLGLAPAKIGGDDAS